MAPQNIVLTPCNAYLPNVSSSFVLVQVLFQTRIHYIQGYRNVTLCQSCMDLVLELMCSVLFSSELS